MGGGANSPCSPPDIHVPKLSSPLSALNIYAYALSNLIKLNIDRLNILGVPSAGFRQTGDRRTYFIWKINLYSRMRSIPQPEFFKSINAKFSCVFPSDRE